MERLEIDGSYCLVEAKMTNGCGPNGSFRLCACRQCEEERGRADDGVVGFSFRRWTGARFVQN